MEEIRTVQCDASVEKPSSLTCHIHVLHLKRSGQHMVKVLAPQQRHPSGSSQSSGHQRHIMAPAHRLHIAAILCIDGLRGMHWSAAHVGVCLSDEPLPQRAGQEAHVLQAGPCGHAPAGGSNAGTRIIYELMKGAIPTGGPAFQGNAHPPLMCIVGALVHSRSTTSRPHRELDPASACALSRLTAAEPLVILAPHLLRVQWMLSPILRHCSWWHVSHRMGGDRKTRPPAAPATAAHRASAGAMNSACGIEISNMFTYTTLQRCATLSCAPPASSMLALCWRTGVVKSHPSMRLQGSRSRTCLLCIGVACNAWRQPPAGQPVCDRERLSC